ncbi:MAG: hypothetical protein INQ03_12715 [Candidatus Heimdallarchaeota archaeon]|nr:hypothetical protein [Candidatus Heimdallarchaeota archaeon]
MNLTTLLRILFIFSLFLLFPMFTPSESIELLPNRITEFELTISNPTVTLTSSGPGIIQINCSLLDLNVDPNTMEIIYSDHFSNTLTLTLDKPGVYIFRFFVDRINDIEISQKGLPTTSIVVIGSMAILVIIITIYEQKIKQVV